MQGRKETENQTKPLSCFLAFPFSRLLPFAPLRPCVEFLAYVHAR